jgi:hypothetical protein
MGRGGVYPLPRAGLKPAPTPFRRAMTRGGVAMAGVGRVRFLGNDYRRGRRANGGASFIEHRARSTSPQEPGTRHAMSRLALSKASRVGPIAWFDCRSWFPPQAGSPP